MQQYFPVHSETMIKIEWFQFAKNYLLSRGARAFCLRFTLCQCWHLWRSLIEVSRMSGWWFWTLVPEQRNQNYIAGFYCGKMGVTDHSCTFFYLFYVLFEESISKRSRFSCLLLLLLRVSPNPEYDCWKNCRVGGKSQGNLQKAAFLLSVFSFFSESFNFKVYRCVPFQNNKNNQLFLLICLTDFLVSYNYWY